MGKGTLIIALGMSIIISTLIIKLNGSSNRGLKTTVDYFEETQARLISNSGIEIYLEKLRQNKSLTGIFNNNTLFEGTYDINIYGTDDSLIIESTGHFNDKTHKSIVAAKRVQVTIPQINSAVYASAASLGLNLSGNMDINGNDHNIDGTPGPSPALPGISVDTPADSAYVINTLKPNIDNSILGAGGAPSVRTVTDNTDWLQVTENYIFAADITLSSGTYSTGTILGTQSSPKITYINGDVNFAGTASGFGIMVVNGNLSMSGNFTFKGIIIAYGQSTIETKVTGNGGIYGATIFVGNDVDIQASGNSSFYYSSQAINLAKTNLKSSRFQILSWWE